MSQGGPARRTPAGARPAKIRSYYTTVWAARRTGDIVLIKTLLYTGVRVAELVKIRIDDVFESSWKKPYSTRGVRVMLSRYAAKAGLQHNMPLEIYSKRRPHLRGRTQLHHHKIAPGAYPAAPGYAFTTTATRPTTAAT